MSAVRFCHPQPIKRGVNMNIIELKENDILILQAKEVMSWEAINKLNKTFEINKIKIILLPNHVNIVGVKYASEL